MTDRIGVYPGTFDPLTLGHLSIIRRAARLVDRLVIGVTTNASKSPMFSVAERARAQCRMLVDQAIQHLHAYGAEADLLRALARFVVDRDR